MTAPDLPPTRAKGPWLLPVGMHRSGTSAVTGALVELGFRPPSVDDRVEWADSNPEHWESRSITLFDDALLEQFGGAWDAPPDLEQGWTDKITAADQANAPQLLTAAFDGSGPFVWKDPRVSLLLPFWKPLLEPPLAAVLIWRDPLAVAESLQRRDHIDRPVGLRVVGTVQPSGIGWPRRRRYLRHSVRRSAPRPRRQSGVDGGLARFAAGVRRSGLDCDDSASCRNPSCRTSTPLHGERVHSPERTGEARGGSAASTRWPSAPRELRQWTRIAVVLCPAAIEDVLPFEGNGPTSGVDRLLETHCAEHGSIDELALHGATRCELEEEQAVAKKAATAVGFAANLRDRSMHAQFEARSICSKESMPSTEVDIATLRIPEVRFAPHRWQHGSRVA